jgi:hypothetical protein
VERPRRRSLIDGQGGFIFGADGIAGSDARHGGRSPRRRSVATLEGDVLLQINTTGKAVDQSISVGNTNIAIKFTATEGHVVRFAILNASISIPPFFELTGDFTIQNDGDMTLYGARDVEIFLGSIPAGQSLRDDAGELNPDAVGLLVTNATVGVIKWAAAPGASPSTPARYAVYAYGEASLVGLDGLTISGSITVRLNSSGQAIDKSIVLPADPLAAVPVHQNGKDDDGDGLIDEAGEQAAIRVRFNSAAKIEEFTAGFNEAGEIDPDTAVTISAAGIFTISGAVSFTRTPNGQVNVDLPQATVAISIPDGEGGLQEVFGLSGAARFHFGGPDGFQLEDIRVSGYSIFGVGATIAAPASSLRAPTADLANPSSTAIASIDDLTYIDVTYQDPNRVGLNDGSITDSAAEFLVTVTDASGAAITGLTVNNTTVVKSPDATNDRTFRYSVTMTQAFKDAVAAASKGVTVTVSFLSATWSDLRGATGAAEVERFTLYSPAVAKPSAQPYAKLASPANGATVSLQTLNAQRYIDVTFFSPTGAAIDAASINGNELRISGAGAANLARNADGTVMATVFNVSGNTYRYLLTPRVGVDPKNTFVAGEVSVQVVAGSWRAGTGASAVDNARSDELFTISATLQTAAAGSNALALGPLSLQGPSVTLAKTQFKDGKLVLTIAIGADVAGLSFGGSQSSSGIKAELTGLLGTFDIAVDVSMALSAITGGGSVATKAANLLAAFSVPGKFGIQVAGLAIEIPNVFKVTGSGIIFNWDPNYKAEDNGGARQRLLVVNQASITFPSFGITGQINPINGVPGLVVYVDGFDIGEAQLIYKPGSGGGSNTTQTSGGTGKIGFAGILEFDDLRIGVTNFKVTFGQAVDFDGTIFIASGGAKLFPGKAVSATISDRLTAEPDIAPGVPNTEAIRVALEFENGKVKGLVFKVDTLRITFGSVLAFNATDVFIDTSAAANEEMVSFRSLGAELTIGSLTLGGEGRNFAFLGDGTFVPKPGFGVFISVGAATGEDFKWPSWLPIKITEIGVTWPDILNDPADFVLTLSAAVTGLQGVGGLEFSGAIDGIKIDVGKLLNGEFPVIDIAAIGVSIKGNLFGGEISAGLIGGIIKLDANGFMIDNFDITTPVAKRIFFVGVEGGFSMAGAGGFGIKFAISELGPLGVYIFASVPGGIVLEPNTGLAINDFSAGVEFFKTLPSIEKPEELRGPDFQLPTAQSADQWLAGVKQQVVKQAQMIQADPSKNGFTAAFTSPMLITGGAKLFTIYASQQVFNGEVILRISTDGKILIVGKLNFAADNLSISGRLYADLSRIASGEATVLFLADIPDQVQLLTIDGRFKMGFRNPNTGQEATFTVVDPRTGKPYARLIGPNEGGVMGTGGLKNRGYLVVDIPAGVSGATLNVDSVTDLEQEFKLAPGSKVTLDNTQAPVLVDGKFWYWVNGDATATGSVSIIWLKETWSYTAADGTTVDNAGGAYEDAEGVWQAESASTVAAIPVFMVPYLDVRLVPSATGEIDDATLQSFATSGAALFRKDSVNPISKVADGPGKKSWILLGDGKVRLFFDPADSNLVSGVYTLKVANAWQDSSGAASDANKSFAFELVDPKADVVGPFSTTRPAMDVHVANAGGGNAYIDVTYKATPGAALDYDSILDGDSTTGFEFTVTGLSGLNGKPTPIEIVIDENGIASYVEVNQGSLSKEKWYEQLANKGISQFRYATTTTDFAPGEITISFLKEDSLTGAGWRDTAGNGSVADAQARSFQVEGPTVKLVSPGVGGRIDIGALLGRGFVDIKWTVNVPGYKLDLASVTDLASEFNLSGPGLGTARLDSGQAPVLLSESGNDYTFRYWISGAFAAEVGADDTVNLELIDGSWSYLADPTHPMPTATPAKLTNALWLTVNFDNVPAGFRIDPASIIDLDAEFSLAPYTGQNAAKNGTGTLALVAGVAPQRIGETNSYRFRVTGNFATDGTQSVALNYIAKSWSFIGESAAGVSAVWVEASVASPTVDASLLAAASTSYIDIALTPSVKLTGGGAYTITDFPDNADIELSGQGITGPPSTMINPVGVATDLKNGVYRYYVDAQQFRVDGNGMVEVLVKANAVTDSGGVKNRATTQTFTVQGTTASVTGPADGGLIGMASLNDRGYLDVTFGFPSGRIPDLATFYDVDSKDSLGATISGAEFSIDPAPGHSIRLDGTHAPVLISQTANTYTFRYFTLGHYASGPVTLTLLDGKIGFTDGSVSTATDSLTVATPETANNSYIDIRYQPTTGNVLDAESITDPGAEFILGGAGQGVTFANVDIPVLRLTGSNTFRYFLSGDFTGGEVTVAFQPGTAYSVRVDVEDVVDADGPNGIDDAAGSFGNLAATERFTVVMLTATLADPRSGNSVDADLLNNRGYFDVDFLAIPLPAGADSIDFASITDLDPEFDVVVDPTGADPTDFTFALDNSQAPVRIGETGAKFRYWYTGTLKTGTLHLTLKAGGFNYLDAANAPTPNAAGALPDVVIDELTTISSTWIDVRYTTAGGVALDTRSFEDASREFTLTGSGLGGRGGVVLLGAAPTLLSSSTDGIDNDGDGTVDEADETVFRYYVSRGFVAGSVAITFAGANWSDKDGNPGEDSTEAFQVISALKQDNEQAASQVFFIEISGGMKLQGLGFTDEPIIDIRGAVTLEIGKFRAAGRWCGRTIHTRCQRHDQDHQAGQHRIRRGALRAAGRRYRFRQSRTLGRGQDPGESRLPEELRDLRRKAPRCCSLTRQRRRRPKPSRSKASPATSSRRT